MNKKYKIIRSTSEESIDMILDQMLFDAQKGDV